MSAAIEAQRHRREPEFRDVLPHQELAIGGHTDHEQDAARRLNESV
jgi:hypothetical protein